MQFQPMITSGMAKVRRDAISIAMQKFHDLCKLIDLRTGEVEGYGVQTYQATQDERVFWFHEISCLIVTDRAISWSSSVSELKQMWGETEEYIKNNALTYENDQKTLPSIAPSAPLSMGPRTEEQDRLNIQAQNSRAAKIGARGSFTYEEWLILREHFGDVCGNCKVPLERPVMDHVIPLSRGGTNYIENIQTLCKACNSGKGAKSIDHRDPELMLSFLEKLELLRKSS